MGIQMQQKELKLKCTQKKVYTAFLLLLCLSFGLNVHAQSDSGGAKKERKTNLNFEDELVEGQTTKPELFYLFQKKNFNYKRLIKLRENFIPEMRKTSEDITRSRSSN